MESVFHGIILALGLILPLGVQNVFVFSQGITQPKLIKAFPAMIAAAVCDTVLIVLSVMGLSLVVMQFEWLRLMLLIGGIIFLLYMGTMIWSSNAVTGLDDKQALPLKKQILFACSVSILNPHALLDTVGVIGTSAVQYSGQAQLSFMLACIAVSWLWFLGLIVMGAAFKKMNLPDSVFVLFNKCSAVFIWGTVLYLLVSAVGISS